MCFSSIVFCIMNYHNKFRISYVCAIFHPILTILHPFVSRVCKFVSVFVFRIYIFFSFEHNHFDNFSYFIARINYIVKKTLAQWKNARKDEKKLHLKYGISKTIWSRKWHTPNTQHPKQHNRNNNSYTLQSTDYRLHALLYTYVRFTFDLGIYLKPQICIPQTRETQRIFV